MSEENKTIIHIEYLGRDKIKEIAEEYEKLKNKYTVRELEKFVLLLGNYVNSKTSKSTTWKIIKDLIK